MSTWINFRDIRKRLSFEAVLKHYGVTIKKKQGNRHVGFCPLPTHKGKRNSPSFSAKLDVGVFQCFGCKAQGTLLHFAAIMEGLDPEDPMALRNVALKLRDLFLSQSKGSSKAETTTKDASPSPKEENQNPNLPVLVNPPLDFGLKDLDYDHRYLKGRGFHDETIRHFGLGFCYRGLMKDRIVIPLHDYDGRLVGYAGRVVDDAMITEENPRYRLPGRRERQGTIIEFKKSLLLYNLHRIKRRVNDLIVVEGFSSVWWLHQWGYSSVVALIGSDCSANQARLIVDSTIADGRVWIFTDADDAGEKCAVAVLSQVSPYRCVRWIRPKQGQPTDCTPGDLESLLPGLRIEP
jgi:DNA primase